MLEVLLKLIHAFVTSRLHCCNSLLYGLPKSQIAKLQRVQNAAARIVTNTHRFEHNTPIIRQLHWLPVSYRIHFKILLLTFKALHGLSPKYIRDLVSIRKVSSYKLDLIFDFKTSELDEVSKSSIWKHTTSCDMLFFSSIIISQLQRPIELKISQVCYFMHLLRYTK